MHRGRHAWCVGRKGWGRKRRVFTLNTLPIHIPELRIRGGMHTQEHFIFLFPLNDPSNTILICFDSLQRT